MWTLVGKLVRWAAARRSLTGYVQAGAGGAAIAVTLTDLRNQSLLEAGGSDPQALDEAARTAARMLGLDGSEVLWPSDRLGNKIAPKYFHVNLMNGQAWYTAEYFSRKSAGRGRFTRRRGIRRMTAIATRIADAR